MAKVSGDGTVERLVGYISNNNYITLSPFFNVTPTALTVTNNNNHLDNLFAFGTFSQQSIAVNLGYKSGDTVTAWECDKDCIAGNDWSNWNQLTQLPDEFIPLTNGNISSNVDSETIYSFTMTDEANELKIMKDAYVDSIALNDSEICSSSRSLSSQTDYKIIKSQSRDEFIIKAGNELCMIQFWSESNSNQTSFTTQTNYSVKGTLDRTTWIETLGSNYMS